MAHQDLVLSVSHRPVSLAAVASRGLEGSPQRALGQRGEHWSLLYFSILY
jgi:hypothetical protein